MEYKSYVTGDELTHWGIKGMRWGIRRYQNKDGSLTPAGKKRYDAEMAKVKEQEAILKRRKSTQAKLDKLAARKKAVDDENEALDLASGKKTKKDKSTDTEKPKLFKKDKPASTKKSAKDMTDEELNAAINRARMEDTYNQLRPKVEKHPFMKKLLNDVVVPAAVSSGKKFLENALTQVGEKYLNGKVDPNSIAELRKTKEKLQLKKEISDLQNPKAGEPDYNKLGAKLKYENDLKDADSRSRGYMNYWKEQEAMRSAAGKQGST